MHSSIRALLTSKEFDFDCRSFLLPLSAHGFGDFLVGEVGHVGLLFGWVLLMQLRFDLVEFAADST